jgi:hypothetical protein
MNRSATAWELGNSSGIRTATFSDQADNGPMAFSLLKMTHTEVDAFGSTQSATQQDRQHCMVALPSDPFDIWSVQERFGLFCGGPISESDAHLFFSFDPTNTSRQLGLRSPVSLLRMRDGEQQPGAD